MDDKCFNALLKRLGERTKAIDEKLAANKNRRCPSVRRENLESREKTPTKEVKKTEVYTTSVTRSTRIDYYDDKTETEASDNEDASPEKENAQPKTAMRDDVMNRLKKMGNLYAGGDNEISSPIHRTEDKFNAEPTSPKKGGGIQSAGLNRRLAALADTINSREDDLRHVSLKPKDEKPVIANRPWRSGIMPSVKTTTSSKSATTILKPVASSTLKGRTVKVPAPVAAKKQPTPTKPVVLDTAVLANLKAQGFERCSSHKNLAYDYNKQDGKEPIKSPEGQSPVRDTIEECNRRDKDAKESPVGRSPRRAEDSTTPTKKGGSRFGSPVRMGYGQAPTIIAPNASNSPSAAKPKPVMGVTGLTATSAGSVCDSARNVDAFNPSSPSRASVRQKAALYESSAHSSPGKNRSQCDPAELPLSQRKALFERNRGAPVMPKQPNFEVKQSASSSSLAQRDFKKISQTKIYKSSSTSNFKGHSVAKPLSQPASVGRPQAAPEKKGLSSVVAMFEQPGGGAAAEKPKEHVQKAQAERQKELDALKRRWDQQKAVADSPVPPPPPMPSAPLSGGSTPKSVTFSPTCTVVRDLRDSSSEDEFQMFNTAEKMPERQQTFNTAPRTPECPTTFNGASRSPQDYPGLKDMKPIKVSPPKPGHIYPNLSDMEMESDVARSEIDDLMDYYEQPEKKYNSSADESSISGDSFGKQIMEAATRTLSGSTLKNLKRDLHMSSSSSSNNSSGCDLSDDSKNEDMLNEFLDEALENDDNNPTPPKRSRNSFDKQDVAASRSFEYQQYSPRKPDEQLPTHLIDGDSQLPLQHTVSFYRRNQTLQSQRTPLSPNRQFIHRSYRDDSDESSEEDVCRQQEAVEKRMRELQQEVSRQETIISQASQALNLCSSTIEFSGSTEQVEAERLLLLATHKRRAALHEIQRLHVEGSLRAFGPDNARLTERGDLILSDITLPLKLDNIRAAAREEKCFHLICLVRCGSQVLSTSMMTAMPRNLIDSNKLRFPTNITLQGLYSDFKVTIEVYGLSARSKEVLPHDIKYHINTATSKKDASKLRLTPKKGKHHEDKLARPNFQSPGGPAAVRSPQFNLIGCVVFSLREINRTHFTLNKVPYTSVLDGSIHVRLSCQMSIDIECRGFLTMFDDISGLGAWHRRWCLLNGDKLSYWKYPEDEKRRIPIDTIDLNSCITERVGLVSRDICARPHTFLLETSRTRRQDDEPSLILVQDGNRTIIRHLLSADTKDDRSEWCENLNKALALLRAWGKK